MGLQWETIQESSGIGPSLHRAKVFGGWLVWAAGGGVSITYVPDPNWSWKLPEPIVVDEKKSEEE